MTIASIYEKRSLNERNFPIGPHAVCLVLILFQLENQFATTTVALFWTYTANTFGQFARERGIMNTIEMFGLSGSNLGIIHFSSISLGSGRIIECFPVL